MLLLDFGHFEITKASLEDLFAIKCHNSSEIKGMKGCNIKRLFSKILIISL